MIADEWEPQYCQNCGHESHCGTNKMKDFRGSRGDGGIEGQIIVCKNCRCVVCTRPDWG
jgi:hypothetical protein